MTGRETVCTLACVAPTGTSSLYAHDFEHGGELIPTLLRWRDEEHLSYRTMIFRLHDDFKIDTSPGTVTKWFRIIDDRIIPQAAT